MSPINLSGFHARDRGSIWPAERVTDRLQSMVSWSRQPTLRFRTEQPIQPAIEADIEAPFMKEARLKGFTEEIRDGQSPALNSGYVAMAVVGCR